MLTDNVDWLQTNPDWLQNVDWLQMLTGLQTDAGLTMLIDCK